MDGITDSLDQLKLGTESDGRLKLRSWLGKFLKFVITDERIIVGLFVCTDKDGNVILENSWEYTETIDGKFCLFCLINCLEYTMQLTC